MRIWTSIDAVVGSGIAGLIAVFLFVFVIVKFWSKTKTFQSVLMAGTTILFIAPLLLFTAAYRPTWIAVGKTYVQIENTFGFKWSPPINFNFIERVYISRFNPNGRGASPYFALVITDSRGDWYWVGQAEIRSQLFPARDQLMQLLEARGIKVSNDPPPAKP